MSDKWDRRFMELARSIAAWSKDPSTQVGCVLVNRERHIIATGYNGFPRGVDDSEERLDHRPTKYLMVQHAEANAVVQAVASTRGATAYVTHHPCANCAGLLIQAGVSRVVTLSPSGGLLERFSDSFSAASTMLDEAGAVLDFLDPPDTC